MYGLPITAYKNRNIIVFPRELCYPKNVAVTQTCLFYLQGKFTPHNNYNIIIMNFQTWKNPDFFPPISTKYTNVCTLQINY